MLLINAAVNILVYYLPFEFQVSLQPASFSLSCLADALFLPQAVRGQSPKMSGITHLAFLVPLLFSPLLSGALISYIGFYTPFMLAGGVVLAVGAGLLMALDSTTSNAKVIGYQLLAGFGGGFCHQIPYTSILHPLPASDIVSGSALCSFLNSLGAIIGIVAAQATFATLLLGNLDKVPGLDGLAVFLVGPNNIVGTEVSPAFILPVRDAYSEALQSTFILPLVAPVLCILCSLGVEWKRLGKGGSTS